MFRLSIVAACIAFTASLASPALAQNQAAPMGAEVTRNEQIKDWNILCAKPPQGGAERCNLIQRRPGPDGKRLILETEVGIGPKGAMITFSAPTRRGLSVIKGIEVTIDGGSRMQIPFLQCLPQLCIAAKLLDDALGAKLRGGNKALVTYLDGSNQPQRIEVSLRGITAGLAQVK